MLTKKGYLINKKNYSNEFINEIKDDLTVTPVQTFNTGNQAESYKVYREDEEYLYLPKFYGIQKFGRVESNELIGETTNLTFNGTLRPNQTKVIDIIIPKLKENDGGLLCLPCGEGKTINALYVASLFKVKTLVIVHKTFLLQQWLTQAKEFTNADVGIIQRNKVDIENKHIVIGMLQSIARDKYDENIFKDFGLVIFDEAHHAPSKYFSKALPIIACKKLLALSATPNRSDKMEKVLYWYFGDIIYKAPIEQLNNVIVKLVKYKSNHRNYKEYTQKFGTEINRPKTINKIVELDKRNKFIIDQIKELLLEEGRNIIILSDRVDHLKSLKKLLDFNDSGFYIGGMKQKDLDLSSECRVIFATYGMAAEGLDIPKLNTLLMVTPRKEVEQSVGRITRKKNHEIQPLIIDIIDQLPCFMNLGYRRKSFYRLKGFEMKNLEVLEDQITSYENVIEEINTVCDFID